MNFITGAGGFLQAVVYGYGGFRLGANELTFNPVLPPTSETLLIEGVNYLGSSIKFDIREDEVKITLMSAGPIAPGLKVSMQNGGAFNLRLRTVVTVPRGKGSIRMS